VRGIYYHTAGGAYVLKYLDKIESVLDKTLNLEQKDEYDVAASVLQNSLYNLVHIRYIANINIML
jgi:hypothetical protein